MSQILNKLLNQNLILEEDIKKINKNIESNKDKIIEFLKKIVTSREVYVIEKRETKIIMIFLWQYLR